MANASKKHMGPAGTSKGTGEGAMTSESVADGRVEENMVLSNRDKSRHNDERGLDSRRVQSDQLQETPMSRKTAPEENVSNTSSQSAPKSMTSSEDSSLESRRKE